MNEGFKVVLSWDAREDIIEAIDRYQKKQNGLGFALDEHINQRMKEIGLSPFLCQEIYGEVRAAHVKKFPFSIFYLIDENKSHVNDFAVRPQSGDPRRWQRRVR